MTDVKGVRTLRALVRAVCVVARVGLARMARAVTRMLLARMMWAVVTVLVVATIAATTGLAPAPAWAERAVNAVNLTVTQTFTTSSPSANDSFTYRLTPMDSSHPMPPSAVGSTPENSPAELPPTDGAAPVGHTFTISGSGNVTIGPIVYDRAGLYLYDLTQVVDVPLAGRTYDQRVYRIQVYVDDDPSRSAHVIVRTTDSNGDKVEHIHFDNGFDQSDLPEATPPYPPQAPTGGRVSGSTEPLA